MPAFAGAGRDTDYDVANSARRTVSVVYDHNHDHNNHHYHNNDHDSFPFGQPIYSLSHGRRFFLH